MAVGLSGGAARWSLSADRPLWPCVQVLGAVLHGVPSPVSMVRWSRTSEELEGLGDVEQSDDVGVLGGGSSELSLSTSRPQEGLLPFQGQ